LVASILLYYLNYTPENSAPASDQDLEELYQEAEVIHFSAVGKPWSYTVDEVKTKRPGAHKILVEQWRAWRTMAMDICPAGTITHA
jgi:hypothetical protein